MKGKKHLKKWSCDLRDLKSKLGPFRFVYFRPIASKNILNFCPSFSDLFALNFRSDGISLYQCLYQFIPFQYLPLIKIAVYASHWARFCFSLGIIKRIAQVRWINTEKTFRQILSWNWNFQWNYPKMNSVNISSNTLRIRDWRTSNLSHSRNDEIKPGYGHAQKLSNYDLDKLWTRVSTDVWLYYL